MTHSLRHADLSAAAAFALEALEPRQLLSADGAGNTLRAAADIGPLDASRSFADALGGIDRADFYRFTLAQTRQVTAAADGFTQNVNLALYNAAGRRVAVSARPGVAAESLTRVLPAGTYYVGALGGRAATDYSLSLTAVPLDRAGNTPDTATQLGTLSGTKAYTDFVGDIDPADYYSFTLAGPRDFTLALSGLAADAAVEIVGSAGNVVLAGASAGAATQVLTGVLPGGAYHVMVQQASGDTDYRLEITALYPDSAGDTRDAARDLGELDGQAAFSDFVAPTDRNDFYRFELPAGGRFFATLSGLTADANLRLLSSTGAVLATSARGRISSEAITRSLAAGAYYVQVYRGAYGETAYNLTLNAVAVAPSSPYAQTVQDPELLALSAELGRDGALSRTDVIALLRAAAADDGLVNSAELSDLRSFVRNADALGMAEPVRILLNKAVNPSSANRLYQGRTLGDLRAGSPAAQVDKLVDKWFFGLDRPATPYAYRPAAGQLFQDGVSYTDIVQGVVGDCYLLAALGAAAFETPAVISSMFVDNGDGTFMVRFYNGTAPDYVTVDRYLPTFSNGAFAYANYGDSYAASGNELWVALAEKAYVQLNESGWIGHGTSNSYAAISGGYTGQTITQITGRATTWAGLAQSAMIAAFNAGKLIALSSKAGGTTSGVISSHAYTLVGYDSATGVFTLYNPWGSTLALTWAQITANFAGWYQTLA